MNVRFGAALNRPSILWLLVCIGVVAVFHAVFLLALGHDFFRSDAVDYWNDSLDWKHPYDRYHLPLYALLISFINGFSLSLDPALIMVSVSVGALLTGCYAAYRLAGKVAAWLFALWPLVGLTEAVLPGSTVLAEAIFLLGLLALLKRPSALLTAAALFGMALVAHKGIWAVTGMMVQGYLFHSRYGKSVLRMFLFVGVAILPLSVLWTMGAFYHKNLLWLFASDLETASGLTLFTGPFVGLRDAFSGSLNEVAKGGIAVLAALAGAVVAFFSIQRLHGIQAVAGAAIGIATMFWLPLLSEHELWAVVRFSRLLAVPVVWLLANRTTTIFQGALVFIPLCLSQVAFGFYTVKLYVPSV